MDHILYVHDAFVPRDIFAHTHFRRLDELYLLEWYGEAQHNTSCHDPKLKATLPVCPTAR